MENKASAGKGPKGKGPNQFHGIRQNYNNFKGKGKLKGSCFVCGKYRHPVKDCRQRKEAPNKAEDSKAQANLAKDDIITAVSGKQCFRMDRGYWCNPSYLHQ